MAKDLAAPSGAAGVSTSAPAGFVRRHRWKLVLVAALVLAVGGVALYTMATLSFSYSTGERVGFVQKLSKKGWLCRTWEGELAMTPVPGAAPEKFAFTIPDEAVAAIVRQSEGKRVALQYEQKKGVPTSCFGETEYFVTGARVVGN